MDYLIHFHKSDPFLFLVPTYSPIQYGHFFITDSSFGYGETKIHTNSYSLKQTPL